MKVLALAALGLFAAGAAQAQGSPADTATPLPQEIGVITVGQTRNGALQQGDWTMGDGTWADVWYLNLTAGQRVTIDMRARFDAYMELLDPWGGRLAHDDDGGDGNAARIVFTAPSAGRYQIIANASGDTPRTGPYTLAVR